MDGEDDFTIVRCDGRLYRTPLSGDVARDLQKPSLVRCKVALNMANSRARLCGPELKPVNQPFCLR